MEQGTIRTSESILKSHLEADAEHSLVISYLKDKKKIKFDISSMHLADVIYLKEYLNYYIERLFIESIETQNG
jgi:hypothetical protein